MSLTSCSPRHDSDLCVQEYTIGLRGRNIILRKWKYYTLEMSPIQRPRLRDISRLNPFDAQVNNPRSQNMSLSSLRMKRVISFQYVFIS